MRVLKYFFSHSFFVSICAGCLVRQTILLLGINDNLFHYLLIFSSTLTAYNFYSILSQWFIQSDYKFSDFLLKQSGIFLLMLSACILMLYSLSKIPEKVFIISLSGVLTLVYTISVIPFRNIQWLKNIGLLKTILLALTWSIATVMIPLESGAIHSIEKISLIFLIRFSGLMMICLIFDLRDIEVDSVNLLQTIIDINPLWVHRIMIGIFCFYSFFVICFGLIYSSFSQISSLLISGILALILYFFSLKKRGYFFYYFWVDGWMIITSFLTYLATI